MSKEQNSLIFVNTPQINHWGQKKYILDTILAVGREIDETHLALRVDFRPNKKISFYISKKVHEQQQGHFPAWFEFIKDVVHQWEGPPLIGSILFWLEDGVYEYDKHLSRKVPVLSPCRLKNDDYTFLIPDSGFQREKGWHTAISTTERFEASLPWEAKRPRIFWRGTACGQHLLTDNWQNNARIKLSLESKKRNDESYMDCAISSVPNFPNPQHKARIERLGIVKDFVPFFEFTENKYLIDIEGEASSWMGYFLRQYTKSLTLKVDSNHIQWFYHKLKPWEHYVPLSYDLSDLDDAMQWITSHDKRCKEIALNAREVMKKETYPELVKETGELFSHILSFQEDRHAYEKAYEKLEFDTTIVSSLTGETEEPMLTANRNFNLLDYNRKSAQ